jgi:hypothetical protein
MHFFNSKINYNYILDQLSSLCIKQLFLVIEGRRNVSKLDEAHVSQEYTIHRIRSRFRWDWA